VLDSIKSAPMPVDGKLELVNSTSLPAWHDVHRPAAWHGKTGKVLLLDGYSTRTLACVRSWGKRGIAFAVGGETPWDMSLFSRYSRETFVYTSPKRDLSKFVQDVNRFSRQFRADSVFPTSEAAIMACSKYQDELECSPIIPHEHLIETVFNKAKTLNLAASLGIPVPATIRLAGEDSRRLDELQMDFPVVIKSSSSEFLLGDKVETSAKTVYAFNKVELEKECRSRLERGQSILLQQYIDGYGVGVSGLFAGGRPVAVIGHRRLRESDPLGGPSALAESIEPAPELLEAAIRLFERLQFTGPAMAEFKVDHRSGRAYLMEINGRFWGTILLALASGLDLPYLYWKMLNSMDIGPEETVYRAGVKGRYILGDTKCLFLCLKGKPQNWPGAFASRLAAIRSYLGSFVDRNTADLILTRDDPKPFFARLLEVLS
jgi:predicted ATP-grasp superfamily ATP-dependent carboligase